MDHILFTGPWQKHEGCRPLRIVMHVECFQGKPQEYIVHNQYKHENGELYYDNGHYYRDFTRAMDKFWERCKAKYPSPEYLQGLDEPSDEFLQTLATNPNV